MRHATPLALTLLLAGSPAWADKVRVSEACDDAHASCRESCTLEFGTSSETRGRFARCVEGCESELRTCMAVAQEDARRQRQAEAAAKSSSPPKSGDGGAGTSTKRTPAPGP